jgi:hypothetical protein
VAVALAVLIGATSGTSCIIPDHGIVALVDCGARWCATAEAAEALNEFGSVTQVQQPQSDGTSGWVTECVCMTPADDLVLLSQTPVMQYDLLRNQILDAARQACIDQAISNGLQPDPPPPQDDALDPSCTEAVTTIFRDGCCSMRNDVCGTTASCDPDPDLTGGEPGPFATAEGEGSGADSTGAGGSTGEMSSLEPYYAEVSCIGTTCRVGQGLIDAIVSSPEAVLAEGTSLSFVADRAGKVVGLELRGVERDNLAGRLGLREGDVVLRVDELPLTSEAELWTAAERAYRSERVTMKVVRDDATHEWVFVRGE